MSRAVGSVRPLCCRAAGLFGFELTAVWLAGIGVKWDVEREK